MARFSQFSDDIVYLARDQLRLEELGACPPSLPPSLPRQVEFKQAKDYVTTIKKRFANEPHQATYKVRERGREGVRAKRRLPWKR